jgi:hypothetical protein
MDLLAEIDNQIAQLKAARAVLTGKTTKAPRQPAKTTPTKKKRSMSSEGRARIAAAMKARWAAAKKASKY